MKERNFFFHIDRSSWTAVVVVLACLAIRWLLFFCAASGVLLCVTYLKFKTRVWSLSFYYYFSSFGQIFAFLFPHVLFLLDGDGDLCARFWLMKPLEGVRCHENGVVLVKVMRSPTHRCHEHEWEVYFSIVSCSHAEKQSPVEAVGSWFSRKGGEGSANSHLIAEQPSDNNKRAMMCNSNDRESLEAFINSDENRAHYWPKFARQSPHALHHGNKNSSHR